APVRAVIRRESNAALIKADSAVRHPCEQIVRFGRTEGDVRFGLPPERAILIDALVAAAVASFASQCAGGLAEIGKRPIACESRISGLGSLVGRIDCCCRCCEGPAGKERGFFCHDRRTTGGYDIGGLQPSFYRALQRVIRTAL